MTVAALTVVILTRNEQANLPVCLRAIPNEYPIVVIDSGSDDATPAIAERAGCAVISHAWEGFAGQRNFALRDCGITTPWVLFVDADEIHEPEFYRWFETVAAFDQETDVFMVPSILYIRGHRLNHAPGYPIYHPRLVRRDTTRFVTNHTGHGEAVLANCRIQQVAIPYHHYFYDGEIIPWMHKHIGKAAMEVNLKPTDGALMTTRGRLSVWLGRSALRIVGRFFYHYILRGGFLDGAAGLEFALMFAWYEASIYLQARAAGFASKSLAARGAAHRDESRAMPPINLTEASRSGRVSQA